MPADIVFYRNWRMAFEVEVPPDTLPDELIQRLTIEGRRDASVLGSISVVNSPIRPDAPPATRLHRREKGLTIELSAVLERDEDPDALFEKICEVLGRFGWSVRA